MGGHSTAHNDSPAILKYGSLGLHVLQGASMNILITLSKRNVAKADQYYSSSAQISAELFKFTVCSLIYMLVDLIYLKKVCLKKFMKDLTNENLLKMAIPATLYVVQNTLVYKALDHLTPALYQICSQTKILFAAMFSILMLGRQLNWMKWVALFDLFVGVVLVVTLGTNKSSGGHHHAHAAHVGVKSIPLGLCYVFLLSCLSGFTGVYIEKVLKQSKIQPSYWMLSLQLSIMSMPFSIFSCVVADGGKIAQNGFFHGWSLLTVVAVASQGMNGLISGLCMKYADNILKGFAHAVSLILVFVLQWQLIGLEVKPFFFIGTFLVMSATYLYSLKKVPSCDRQNIVTDSYAQAPGCDIKKERGSTESIATGMEDLHDEKDPVTGQTVWTTGGLETCTPTSSRMSHRVALREHLMTPDEKRMDQA